MSRSSSRSPPGTCASGSGGESRLIRCSHGADAWHAQSARRALELWREVDPALVAEAGVAWFARREDGWEAAVRGDAARARHPVRARGPGDAVPVGAHRRPRVHAVRARGRRPARARRDAHARGAGGRGRRARGRTRRRGPTARAWSPATRCSRPTTSCGRAAPGCRRCSATCCRCGSPSRTCCSSAPAREWTTPGVPGWVDYDGAFYGVGDLDGRGVKVSPDVEGPPIDVEAADRFVRPEHLAARARVPGAAASPRWRTRRWSARACASTRSRPTRASSSPRTRSTRRSG